MKRNAAVTMTSILDETEKSSKLDVQEPTVHDTEIQFDKMAVVESTKSTENKAAGTKKEKLPKPSLRFDKFDHLPYFDDPTKNKKGYKCKREGCGLSTSVYCSKCQVHLCFVPGKKGRNCFSDFHSVEKS